MADQVTRADAHAAAADGWPVMPVQPGRKGPPWEPEGVWSATTDPARIDAWGWVWSICNLAGRTGDGYLALDDDPAEGSEATIAAWAEQGCTLPATRTHRTPHGGLHPIYLAPPGTPGGQLGPGVMVRGHGSYIVLPPSVLVEHGQVVGCWSMEDDRPEAPAPGWLVDYLTGRKAIHTPAGLSIGGHRAGVDGLPLELEAEPVELEELPWHLVDVLEELDGRDRSGKLWHLVAACLEYGLRNGQVITLARAHGAGLEKYGDRLELEVARCLAKLRPRHPHAGQACDHAGCPHAPAWYRGGVR